MITKQSSQNIDELIKEIRLVIEDRCSPSGKDRETLEMAIGYLEEFQRTLKTNGMAQLLLVVKAIELVWKFFK